MYYTGIGSRECPTSILHLIECYSTYLDIKGYCLRSGGAEGADSAFQRGSHYHEIFLPWNGFNGLAENPELGIFNPEYFTNYTVAQSIAATMHPAWERLKPAVRKLHTRNVYQVLGVDLNTPSKAVVCWALPDTKQIVKGGTGLAVRLAAANNIPIFNLHDAAVETKVRTIINAI